MASEGQFQAYEISSRFNVVAQEATRNLNIPKECHNEIEQIWQEELKKSEGKLFNGQLLCFVALEKEKLIGEFVDYKYFLAQHLRPALQPILQIEPIGVSSLTMAGRKILCGCRSQYVSTYPERFELAPSGGIDSEFIKEGSIDFKGQLISELHEETGIHSEHIVSAEPFALIHDKLKGGYDLCIALQLKREAIQETWLKSHEYGNLCWKAKKELLTISKEKQTKENWVPLSIYLIDHFL